MKVLNLRCEHGHGFEGWFGSDEDYAEQTGRGLLECPLCASRLVTRLPSAPRLNLSVALAPPAGQATTPERQGADAMWLHAMRRVMAHTEDVGKRFAEEARRIHHGEVPERGIRGQASRDEAESLRDEGIEVHALPQAFKSPLQ